MTFLKNCWYVAAHASEVGRTLLARTILNEKLVMYRGEDGTGHAIGNVCPHRFALLSKGKLLGDIIECPYHGLRFDASGACVHNPHGGPVPRHAKVKSYPLAERHGFFWIWMGARELADPSTIPDFSPLVQEGFAPVSGYLQIEANYLLIVDNLMDLSHIQFLHPMLSAPEWLEKRQSAVSQEPGLVRCTNRAKEIAISAIDRIIKPDALPVGEQWLDLCWNAPSSIFLDVRFMTAAETMLHPIGHCLTPETDSRTHYFFRSARNQDTQNTALSQSIAEQLRKAFTTEDEPMIEDQQLNLGAIDLMSANPVILKSDSAAVRVRRALAQMIVHEGELPQAAATVDREPNNRGCA